MLGSDIVRCLTPELNRTFAIELMRNFQKEYGCNTPSEKATAELAANSYVRMLSVQRKLNNFIEKDAYGDLTVKVIAVVSK